MNDSVRELLEAEYDAAEEETEAEASQEEAPDEGGTEGGGEPTEIEGGEPEGNGEGDSNGDPEAGAEPANDQTIGEPQNDGLKAPIGWGPEAREEWGKLPAHVRKAVHAREVQIAQAMHGTAEARKTQEFLTNIASSYTPVLAAEGYSNPAEAIEGIIQTVAQLRMGSPSQKADLMANLIQHYGIEPKLLDQSLSGYYPNGAESSGGGSELEYLMEQKMQPFYELMSTLERAQGMKAEQSAGAAKAEVAKFAQQAEFLEDVRLDMADYIDLKEARGEPVTLQQAYDFCCQANPNVRAVLAKREEAKRLATASQRVAGKRAASSSISGTPGGGGTGGKKLEDMDTADILNSLWDEFDGN